MKPWLAIAFLFYLPGAHAANVFALNQINSPSLCADAALSQVDGVAIQINWRNVEPSDGVFDFSQLNTAISCVVAANKPFSLHLIAFNANNTPTWLPCQKITGDTGPLSPFTNGACKPTDPVYIAKYKGALQALRFNLASQGSLGGLYALGAVVPTSETDIADCINGSVGNYTYNRSAYMAVWKNMADFYNSTFTGVKFFLSAPGNNQVCINSVDTTFYQSLYTYAVALTTNFTMFGADLTNTGSGRVSSQQGITPFPPVAFQFKGAYVLGGSGDPYQAVCWALSKGTDYIEFYSADLNSGNSVVTNAVTAAHVPSTCMQ